MGIPFAVNHKKLGFLITVLVPFGWLIILGGLEKIRKGIILGLGLYVLNIFTSIIARALFESSADTLIIAGFVIIIISLVAHFGIWWYFYSKWIEEWRSKYHNFETTSWEKPRKLNKFKKKFTSEHKVELHDRIENPEFGAKQFNFSEGLERVIELTYNKEKEVDVKLFFSDEKEEWNTFTRNYKEKVKDNFVRLKIETANKSHAKLISGGNYDFNDGFDEGYSLYVALRYGDKKLFSQISSVLRSNQFGCLPTKFTIHAHRNQKHPTETEAKEILAKISKDITNELTQRVEN
jgi:hypothetical protein